MSSATTSRQRLLDRLSDEDLGREFAVLWERYWIENVPFTINGERVPEISDTQLEQILPTSKVLSRIAIFDQDTDNEGLMGVQRALQLGASGYYIRAGRIFRAYIERVDEARTGRRRATSAARKPRPGRRHYLQDVLREIVTANPGIRWEGVLEELRRREGLPRDPKKPHIERVCEVEGVEWLEPGKIARDPLPMSKVKAIFYKERDGVRRPQKLNSR